MTDAKTQRSYWMDHRTLPTDYPTHLHTADFWEALGRTVATFGHLEAILIGAIFAFTGTKLAPKDNQEAAVIEFAKTLRRTLSETLHPLIQRYGKAVREHPDAKISRADLQVLLDELLMVSSIRNALCHGSWRRPDADGKSSMFYVDKTRGLFDSSIDTAYLHQVRAGVVKLCAAIINTVTAMGWQFPGPHGPGRPLWDDRR